jgi:hypothetical protein
MRKLEVRTANHPRRAQTAERPRHHLTGAASHTLAPSLPLKAPHRVRHPRLRAVLPAASNAPLTSSGGFREHPRAAARGGPPAIVAARNSSGIGSAVRLWRDARIPLGAERGLRRHLRRQQRRSHGSPLALEPRGASSASGHCGHAWLLWGRRCATRWRRLR